MLIFNSFLDATNNVVFERWGWTGIDRRVTSSHGEAAKVGKVGSARALQLGRAVISNEKPGVWSPGGSTIGLKTIKDSLIKKILRASALTMLIRTTTLYEWVLSCKRTRFLVTT